MATSVEIKVPSLGESVSQATIVNWLKGEGDSIAQDETILELETEKVTIEVNAPQAGILTSIKIAVGQTVAVGDLVGLLETSVAVNKKASQQSAQKPAIDCAPDQQVVDKETSSKGSDKLSPAVRKSVAEQSINPKDITGSGKDGRLLKADVINFNTSAPTTPMPTAQPTPHTGTVSSQDEERIPMSRLRQTIARRLKEAQNTAALLTTFNEVDMSELIQKRSQYKDSFEKKYGVKLGFMSFFVKACLVALKEYPTVNAAIDQNDIVYKNHYDIGVAVSTPQGLVVPVIKNADRLDFAGIEKTIADLAGKGRNGTLTMADMTGGTFTITNGGVFGSLMSTPIINAPQSAILGMHKTQDRPIAVNGQVVIRPMMYLALTYDHRIIDGREAVSFLIRVKECIENPERILLAI